MDILVTGSLGYDYIMDFPGRFADRIMPDKIHSLSLSFLVDTLHKQFGGTAGNIAYTLQLLGEYPHIIAPAGNDFSPYLIFLKRHHMDISGITVHRDIPTSSYFVITDQNDNQIGSFFIGALKYATRCHLLPWLKKKKNLFAIISPSDPKAMVQYVDECIARKIPYLFDPAFQIATLSPTDLKKGITHASMAIGNDYEISLMEKQLEITHKQLRMLVPIVITTLGPKGSIIEEKNNRISIKPAKVSAVVDPTGAGDAYRGGFIAGYVRGCDLKTCGQMGSVAAVYTVEKYGTVTHTYTKKQFVDRYQRNYSSKFSIE